MNVSQGEFAEETHHASFSVTHTIQSFVSKPIRLFFSFQGDTSRHWGVGQRVYESRGSDSHQEEELETLHPHHAGRSREEEHQTVMDHLK